jgi:hypothetical protein
MDGAIKGLRALAHLALFTPTCLGILATTGFAPPAQALPSFARQTGQPCGTCHTDFPALTPFGRRFKLLGYTTGGGKFRTTPFPSSDDARAAADRLRNYAKDSGRDEADKPWVPPVSMMAIPGYTHTQAPLAPPTAPYSANDNTVLANPFSAFWGGAVTEHIGAFAQVTYAPPGPGDARRAWPSYEKAPTKSRGSICRGAICGMCPQRTGAFLPPAAWR